ncbi:leucine-rich repeat-containing protein 17 [Callorhinchus milii]|uniref:Leucine rich repeat containing 17 n=1 Tax=Callorhinchus milii TaxID=7868 RepID=A0A4W3JRI1_CALMI|nr:leucine-rich repeat-containing protein 17 [Callorhinchus milii]|eukprot:gi/632947518/ref/XP_007889085.1/ PREDICTED: leucine-rich repeat-containing protein 17 [Callorhinchus milii]
MQMVKIILFLLLCTAVELRKIRNGRKENRNKHCGAKCMRKHSSHVKRFAHPLKNICEESLYYSEKVLTCQDKQLITIPSNLPDDIVHLQLAGNKINRLKDSMFSTLKNLKSLDLQRNDITTIQPGAFEGLDDLNTLLLQHNQLRFLSEEVFIPIPKLNYLRIYDNPWDCNCNLEDMVRKLQVPGHKNLGNLAKCKSPKVYVGQKLKKINPDWLCPNNIFSNISEVMDPPSSILKEVDFTRCHIYLFPKPQVDCQDKDLTKIPIGIPADVLEINLGSNKIKQLNGRDFIHFKKLDTLNLSNNHIETIDPAAFTGLLRLKTLDLSNNNLHSFKYGVLEDLYFIEKLVLTENPWKCDYQIHYLAYWLQVHYTVQFEGLECTMPNEFKGWTVQRYIKKYYEECPKENVINSYDYDISSLEEEEHGIRTRIIP